MDFPKQTLDRKELSGSMKGSYWTIANFERKVSGSSVDMSRPSMWVCPERNDSI